MKITDLKPEIVWKFFHQVTQVPRPSKKEGKMIQYLESFAKEYKIAIKKDAAGNILMSKPATPVVTPFVLIFAQLGCRHLERIRTRPGRTGIRPDERTARQGYTRDTAKSGQQPFQHPNPPAIL